MHQSSPRPVVHLELHTGDQARASAFYAKLLCWRPELIEAGSGSYLALELGGGFGGGIVECGTAALQHLPARQRAVLILRDVLGFSARETATALETTPVSVDSALQRAHKTVDQRLPEQSQQATLRSLGDGALRQVVERYVTAWERNDVDAVVAMLADDAKMTMPPLPTWYRGREQVAIFLGGGLLAGATRWRLIPVRANGQLAFFAYAWDDKTQAFMPHAVNVLTLRGAQIQEITAFLTPDAFRGFDLPAAVPANS
jgi:RNA polymerase sigma-70 factor (ECF subfamily)